MSKHWLDMGMTFSVAQFESGGIDKDGDHLTLTFSDDPAARTLQIGSDGS